MRGQLWVILIACFVLPAAPLVQPVRSVWGVAAADVEPAAAEDEEEQKLRAAIEKARATAGQLFHDVEITFRDFRPSAVKEAQQHFGYGMANHRAQSLSLDKRVLTLDVILVDAAKGLFVTADPDLDFDMIQRMELKAPGEQTFPVELVAIYADQNAVLLRAQGFSREVALPGFAEGVIKDGEDILAAAITRFGDLRDVRVTPLALSNYLRHGDELHILSMGGPAASGPPREAAEWQSRNRLLFDADGELAAIAVSPMLVGMGGRKNHFTDWPGESGSVPAASLRGSIEQAVSQVGRHTYRIKMHFRQEEDEGGSYRYYGPYYLEEDVPEDEWIAYGLAVDSGLLFIPFQLERDKIETIESITVELKSGEEVAGEFAGLFEEFAGTLVRCPSPLDAPAGLWAEREIPDGRLFIDVSLKQRFGAKDALPKYNRFFGTEKGYKDKEFRGAQRPILPGSWVLAQDGALYGFATQEKRYESVADDAMSWRYRSWGSGEPRCFVFAEMKDRFENPDQYLDASIKVKGIQERKELAWVGVESQPITPELAKLLQVEKETRDGQFGLLVSLVYEESPAARMGIQPGDLLLKIQEEGKAGEHVLRGGYDYRYSGYWQFPDFIGDAMPDIPFVQREWFNRRNSLTEMLTRIGIGKKAVLSFSHAHEVKSAQFVVEKAPPDLNSADKFKSEWTGLTVKDITYEVRRVLRLEPDFQAVIVYEVEPGSSGSVGQIGAMEFIEEIEGQKVTDIGRFEEILKRLVEQETKRATFKVRNLDESRFVKVELEKPKKRAPAMEELLKRLPGLVPK